MHESDPLPDVAALIRPGDTVLWGQADAEPLPLTQALMAQRHRIGGRIRAFVGMSLADTVSTEHADCIDFASYCGAGRNRALARAGLLDIWPWHYSELAAGLASGAVRADVLLLQLAPPDALGRFSLGIAHEYLVPALDRARVIIAEVNDQAPWTYGERYLGAADLDMVVRTSRAPLTTPQPRSGPVELALARHVAGLIGDGCTLQMGLGNLPALVLGELRDRRDLGIHSGTIGDAVADLMESGCITNAKKAIDRGVSIAGTMMATARLHAYAHRNPALQFRSTRYTHDPQVLAAIDRFVSLNSALEVDLTGAVNSEVAGGVYVGAVGGALDFLRGARRSRGGLPIIALPSTAGAASRIVATLSGPTTIPRSDAAIIVTEHGVADLRGLTLRQRVDKMLAIAHPDWQARLAGSATLP
ncbi:MAG: acetyl-CoA hydrolase/transferase family protein [Betaproteobacteria bacterium]|nr:acetyl-CoA hydrolase/transferase family protein [Betaproteobacteria bacterium]